MNLVHSPIRDQEELDELRQEKLTLELELREKEQELTQLQKSLREFELVYLETLGHKYDELAAIEKEIAVLMGEIEADDEYQISTELECSQTRFQTPENLKKLYREVARLCHPDLADNEQDRLHRHQLMTAANEAYQDQSEERLLALLNAEASVAEIIRRGSGELALAVREVRILKSQLSEIADDLDRLGKSEMNKLRLRAAKAAGIGHDFLGELTSQIERQIRKSGNRLETLKAEVRA